MVGNVPGSRCAAFTGVIAMAFLAAGARAAFADIAGLQQLLDPTVVTGTVIDVPGPPSNQRDGGSTNSVAWVRPIMKRRMGAGSIHETVRSNWPSTRNPDVTLAELGASVQQAYDDLVVSRLATPQVDSVDVENFTFVYPASYYDNAQPVTVHTRRFTLNGADGRTVVGYYANYDKLGQFDGTVVLQVNGHFGPNPSRRAFGLEANGGLIGAALGKLAMQGLPIVTYDDPTGPQNVGESSAAPNGLPRTLEQLQMVDRTLLTCFDHVQVVGLSGGTERLYHLMGFFESNVQSAYMAGYFDPTWTSADAVLGTNSPFGVNQDTYDAVFFEQFSYADLVLLGMSRGVSTAFASATREGGYGKWGLLEEMVPTINRYTHDFQLRGDDINGDGIPDDGPALGHEYNLPDLMGWLTCPGCPGAAAGVTVQTTSLRLADDSGEPANPARRRITFRSRTRTDGPVNRIQPPPFGDPAGDPTMAGATLRVHNAAGSGEQFSTTLPASGWLRLPLGSSGYGYRYRGAPGDPVESVEVASDLISIRAGKDAWGYTLDEPSQGRIGVRLSVGSRLDWCAEASAKTSGSPPSTAANDRQDKFVAASKTPPPPSCPSP